MSTKGKVLLVECGALKSLKAVYPNCNLLDNLLEKRVFNSAIKIFSDFIILCSEKSNNLLKYALKGAQRHNVDISKTLTDSIRLLNLEKYVYY